MAENFRSIYQLLIRTIIQNRYSLDHFDRRSGTVYGDEHMVYHEEVYSGIHR